MTPATHVGTKRYVKMEVAKGVWQEWSIDPWADTPEGYVSFAEDNGVEYWKLLPRAMRKEQYREGGEFEGR
jgi:hypothetical protein